jgi:hypothetical protein
MPMQSPRLLTVLSLGGPSTMLLILWPQPDHIHGSAEEKKNKQPCFFDPILHSAPVRTANAILPSELGLKIY